MHQAQMKRGMSKAGSSVRKGEESLFMQCQRAHCKDEARRYEDILPKV